MDYGMVKLQKIARAIQLHGFVAFVDDVQGCVFAQMLWSGPDRAITWEAVSTWSETHDFLGY